MKKRQNNYLRLAAIIEIVHIGIAIITVTLMILLFFWKPIRIFSSLWICSIWIIWQIYGNCPLTVKEYELRQKAGEKVEAKKFIPRFFKRYFKIDLPDYLATYWMNFYFIIAVFILWKTL